MLGIINPADNPLSLEFYRILAHNFLPAVAPAAVAFAVTVALFWPGRWLSFKLGAVAEPGGRNIHTVPTGRLGGLALAAGFLTSAAIFGWGGGFSPAQLVALLMVGGGTVVVMAKDDITPLRARWTFGLQVLLAIALVVAGIRIGFINFGSGHVWQLGLLAVPVTVLWLVGMQNTMNLLDGVDGLAAGVAAIVGIALLLAAVNREQSDPSQLTIVLLSAGLIGACAGFLLFNFYPARIFLGGGAHFLGLVLGVLSIFGIAKGAVVFALVVPAMALAIPIADTARSIIRRRRGGVSIAHADTAHIHHQLLDFGLTQRQTCLVIYSATGITAGLGLMLYGHKKILAAVVVLLVVALSTLLGDRLYAVENSDAEGAPEGSDGKGAESGVLLES